MADQGRWFKLWFASVTDDKLSALPNELWAIWAKLGAYIKTHGNKGVIEIKPPSSILCSLLKVDDFNDLINAIKCLPNTTLRNNNRDNGFFTVSFNNWVKYQEDSTSYKRLLKHRKKLNDNGIRREEKRREKEENKHIYGEFKNVRLKDEELQKLKDKFGDAKAKEWIKIMDEGIETKGYKYTSHYLAILKWAKNAEDKGEKRIGDYYPTL